MKTKNATPDLSAQIAKAIRDAIVEGRLIMNERLPSESELSEQFNVSRPTVREALKRLAAQNLIRTQRGAFGGAFINRISYPEAYGQQITTSTLLLSMNEVSIDVACEARFTMERSCAHLAAQRRTADHLATMRAEIHRQSQPGLSDIGWCASDITFHRALVDATQNPVLCYQMAGAVEAMQPLMNMITFSERSRQMIIDLHIKIADGAENRDSAKIETALIELSQYTIELAHSALAKRTPQNT